MSTDEKIFLDKLSSEKKDLMKEECEKCQDTGIMGNLGSFPFEKVECDQCMKGMKLYRKNAEKEFKRLKEIHLKGDLIARPKEDWEYDLDVAKLKEEQRILGVVDNLIKQYLGIFYDEGTIKEIGELNGFIGQIIDRNVGEERQIVAKQIFDEIGNKIKEGDYKDEKGFLHPENKIFWEDLQKLKRKWLND